MNWFIRQGKRGSPGSPVWVKAFNKDATAYNWVAAIIEKIDLEHKLIEPSYLEEDSEDDENSLPKKVMFYNLLYRDAKANKDFLNLLALEHINEGNILHVLNERFNMDIEKEKKQYKDYEFCTYCGNILVYINPNVLFQDAFDERRKNIYFKRLKESYYEMTNMPPHLYSVVMAAVHPLVYSKKKASRSLVFFGESGSGKTESLRFSLEFIAYCFSAYAAVQGLGAASDSSKEIEKQVSNQKLFRSIRPTPS